MRPPSPLSIAVLATCIALPAQETDADAMAQMLTPAKQTAKFDVMLGSWTGKGTAKETPDGESMSWTGRTRVKRVLGGHFVQEDVVISFPGLGDATAMMYRGYHGFNRDTKRYMSAAMANDGSVASTQIHFVGDKTMMTSVTMVIDGKTIHDRWISKYAKDSYTICCLRSVDAGEEFELIKGHYERASGEVEIPPIAKLAAFMPGIKPLKKLKRTAGKYRMKGKMIPAPGAPMTEIAATETIESIFSDSVLLFQTKGDDAGGFAYEGIGMMAWDPPNDCYKMVFVNNMGECSEAPAWLKDDKFISTWSGVRMGQPTATHTVCTLRDDGSFEKIVSHSSIGSNPPVEAFSGTYEKTKTY